MDYDLIVIGGGPAGIMAGARAAENGACVLLLEKNDKLGIKLLITGKGRCNITNTEFDARGFTEKFGKNGKFLFSALHKFGTRDIIKFFENRGVMTKKEGGGRIFPKSDKSCDVLNALIDYLKENKVRVRTKTEVRAIIHRGDKIEKVILTNGEELSAKKYAICTGGKSYPLTGSSGDGYKWLLKMGHTIISPKPALTPILTAEKWIKDLEGLSLENMEISIYQNNKKIDSRFGEALFTAVGLSGPIVLDISKSVGRALKRGRVDIHIDFKPALSFGTLDKRIQRNFKKFNNKMFKNSLNCLLPKTLIPVIARLAGIDPEKKVNSITKTERKKILHLLKSFKLQVKKLDGFNKAVITSGGVDLKEVEHKTMQSKIVENLYVAGEILDLDGPTGGVNLQVCWSTGYAVGDSFL